MTGLGETKLFAPFKLGSLNLKHRVIMAPLTRVRSPEHIPDENVVEYYQQRASDGGLIITEATHISVMGGNYHGAPGIFTPEQKRAWKKVTDAVHSKGGYIYCQLWHIGRTSHPSLLGGRKPFGPSTLKVNEGKVFFTPTGPQDYVEPQQMTLEDIKNTIDDYVHAAKYAIEAGFDGVEVHGANGYLLDQFICDNINTRTDAYGGSVENRGRLVLEVTDAVIAAVGADKVGVRLSPFSFFQGTATSDIISHYGYVVQNLEKKGLSYVHLVEPRSDLIVSEQEKLDRLFKLARERGVPEDQLKDTLTLKPFRKMLAKTPLISAGEFNDKNSVEPIENGEVDAVVFGRYFISNPDLPERLKNGYPLSHYDRSTFYVPTTKGYTDYPTYEQQKQANGKL